MKGKCKADFDKWFINTDSAKGLNVDDLVLYSFYKSRDSMKWGVYVDYYGDCGIYITDGSGRLTLNDRYYYWVIEVENIKGQYDSEIRHKTRHEARTEAEEKACEIREKQLSEILKNAFKKAGHKRKNYNKTPL